MEAVRDDEQSPPKAGRTGLPQGKLSEVSGRFTWHASLPRQVDIWMPPTFVAQNTSFMANWIERGPPI